LAVRAADYSPTARRSSAAIGNSNRSPRNSRVEKNKTSTFIRGFRIEARNDFVFELLRFLLGIRGAFVDMQDVRVAVVFETQFRPHSTSPSASRHAM
jgi:hypothetical protein